jgi:hypothetical protein
MNDLIVVQRFVGRQVALWALVAAVLVSGCAPLQTTKGRALVVGAGSAVPAAQAEAAATPTPQRLPDGSYTDGVVTWRPGPHAFPRNPRP